MTDPTPDKAAEVPDTITRYAVYDKTLEQFVGGVSSTEPSAADTKALMASLGRAKHKTEVRTV